MKIAIVSRIVYPYSIGGSGRYVTFLANHMVKQGVTVEVISPPLAPTEIEFNLNFKVVEVNWSKVRPFLLAYYLFMRNAAKYISTQNYDLIYWTGWAVWRFKRESHIPSIANPFGLEPFKSDVLVDKLLYAPMNLRMRLRYRHIDRIVSEGGKITEEIVKFLGVERSRIVEIPDGVDLDYIERMEKTTPSFNKEIKFSSENIFLFVGRLETNKGVDYLLKAFNTISDDFDVELLIVGEGTQRKRLESYNKNRKVKFLGLVSDEVLFQLYNKVDLFVFPTLYEGLPIVILEAMACGLPVISTDTGGVPAAVNEKNGFLIPPKDVDALKSAMINFLRLPEKKKREMGRNSYELVKSKFTWPKIAKKTIEVCEGLLRNS